MDPLDRLIACLPQKPPSLYVDRILELLPGDRVRGEVTFPPGHRVFDNHLPDEPLVPGVILIEAMAQVAGLVLVPPESLRPIRGYLGEVRHMRFRRRVGPGSTVAVEARLLQSFGNAHRFETEAIVDGNIVAAGQIVLAGDVAG